MVALKEILPRGRRGGVTMAHLGETYLGVPAGFQYLQKRYCPSALTK